MTDFRDLSGSQYGELAFGCAADTAPEQSDQVRPARPGMLTTGEGVGTMPVPEVSRNELVQIVAVAFRRHPHVGNVLTHVSGARWDRVAAALDVIFDPSTKRGELSPIAMNLVELISAEGGPTGRILKPFISDLLERLLPSGAATRLLAHVEGLLPGAESSKSLGPAPDATKSGGRGETGEDLFVPISTGAGG